MKTFALFSTLILGLWFASCGGDGNGGGDSADKREKVFNPWEGVGTGSLTEEVSERVRELAFADGMTVSYDGSAEDGSEQVCRRQQSEDVWYEVCMPLEDNPYFVLLPYSAFVWHPLMFDRFATDLICRFWTEPGEGEELVVREEICDASFFESMGGAGFRCEAGPVGGDKGLVCSDDWAVAVNGRDEDTKTVCRVHIEVGSGRCLGAPQEGIEDASLVLNRQRTDWEGYRSVQDNPRQFAPGDVGQLVTPQDTPPGAELSYTSEDEDICAIHDAPPHGEKVVISSGVTAPTTCRIFLTVVAEGYADRVIFVELPILKASDVTWANYSRINNYFYPGEGLVSGAVNSTNPVTTQNSYQSLDESVCTVDGDSGELTAMASGDCVVRLTARASGYLDTVLDKIVPVNALAEFSDRVWGIDWVDFPSSATVGVDTAVLALPQVLDGDDAVVMGANIAVASESESCAYNAGVISFEDAGECVIAVTARVRGHHPERAEFRLTPGRGSFALAWTGYAGGNTATFGAAAPDVSPPTITPVLDGVDYSYAASGGGCEVDSTTGELTILGVKNCTVSLTATRGGYQDMSLEHTVTIAKANQTIVISVNHYGNLVSLANGESSDILNPPSGGIGDLVYTVSGSCSIDESTGRVTAEAATGNCVVRVRWLGNDNYNSSSDVQLTTVKMVANASGGTPLWAEPPYPTNPTVGGTSVTPSSLTGVNSALEFQSLTPDICRVVDAAGAITGVSAGSGCRVRVRFVGNSTKAASNWMESPDITVEKGVPTVPENIYGVGAQVGVDKMLELPISLEFGTATWSLEDGSEDYCSVDAGTGTVVGIATGGTCLVRVAFAGNDNYEPSPVADAQTITVVAGGQSLTFENPYGEGTSLRVGEERSLVEAPVGNQAGTISYQVKAGRESYCSVHSSDGIVQALSSGECIIQARAEAVPPHYGASSWTDIATILVEEGVLIATWNPQREGRWNENLLLEPVDVASSGATVTYTVKDAGDTGCALSGSTGNAARTLEFTGPGLCQVEARASLVGYGDWVREHALRILPAEIQVGTVGQFGNTDTLRVGGSDQTPSASSSIVPAGTTANWRLVRGERDCRLVNAQTGAVLANTVPIDNNDPPVCSLQLVVTKDDYETFKSAPVDIPLEKGNMRAVVFRYGSGVNRYLPVGGYIDLIQKPQESNGLPVVPIAFAVASSQSDGTSKADVCSVDNDPASPHFGRISAESEGAATDKCEVTVTVESPGYTPLDTVATLTLQGDQLKFDSMPVPSWTGNLKVGGSGYLPLAEALPTQDDSETPVEVIWRYRILGFDSEGNRKYYVCSVVDNPGGDNHGSLAAGNAAMAGDTCRVQVVATANNYLDTVLEEVSLTVEKGDLSFATAAKPAIGDLRLGALVEPDVISASVDDNSVAVTWGDWRVEGFDSSDPPEAKNGVCSVENDAIRVGGDVGDVCQISVVASAPSYNDVRVDMDPISVVGLADFGTITTPRYSEVLTVRGYPVPVGTLPGTTPAVTDARIRWTYRTTAAEGVCTVDENTGTITPGADAEATDFCTVIATANADGYNSKDSGLVALRVHGIFQRVDWPSFPSEATVGVGINLSASGDRPVGQPVADSYSVSKVSGDCAYSNAHLLTFTDTTECVLKVVATKTNYVSIERLFRITPEPGTIQIAGSDNAAKWGTYNSVTVGAASATAAPALGTITPNGVSKAYRSLTSSVCAVDSGTGAVTGLDDDECRIGLVLSVNAYNDLEYIYTLTVGKGTIQVAGNTDTAKWGSYPTMEVGVVRTESAPAIGTTTPASVEKVYSSLTPTICSATPQGAVTASTHGSCQVKLVLSIDNYNDKEYTYSFNVTKGTIAVAGSDEAAKWGTYPTLTVGTSVDAPDTGEITPSGASKTYSSLTSAVCSVDAQGAVTGLDDAECQIKLVLSSDNYFDLSHTYTFTVGKGTIAVAGADDAAKWGSYETVQVGAASATAAPAVGTLTPSDTTKSYTSDTPAVCSVDAQGAVTGIDDASCEITLTLSRNNYNDRTYTYTFTVEAGVISVAGATDTAKWGSYGPVTVGGGVTQAPAIGTVTPTGAAKAYTSLTASACNVYETTGEVTAVAASAGNCRIRLTLSADGYDDTTKTYTFSVGKGTQTGVAWNPGSTTTHLGAGSVELGAVSGADSSASITYSVVSAGETGCAFGSGSDVNLRTLSFSALGTCQVKATVTRSEYNDWNSGTIDITVASSPPVGISWTGYGGGANTAGYGNTAPELDSPTLNPATATATYTHTGSACSVTSDGTLTVLALGTCQVTLSATPADSNNLAATATVTVTVGKGTQPAPAIPANMYGANPTLVTGGTLEVVNAPTGGHGEPSYVVWTTSRSVCRLDNSTGEITALLNGNCIVVFNWTGDANYLPSSREAIFNIAIGKGTIAITDAGSYTGTLTVGGESLTPSTPTATPAGVSFAYALKAGEADCTLNSGTTGEVTANAVAITSGTECEVVLTASKTGYNDETADIAVPMQGAQLTFATPPLYPRNALALSGTLRPDPLPPSTDDNSIAVTWTFSAAGTRSGSTQSGVCSVNNDCHQRRLRPGHRRFLRPSGRYLHGHRHRQHHHLRLRLLEPQRPPHPAHLPHPPVGKQL